MPDQSRKKSEATDMPLDRTFNSYRIICPVSFENRTGIVVRFFELKGEHTMKHDKENWARGEWDNEPDDFEWIHEESGYHCILKRNHSGVWCGYVMVPDGHPYHGLEYMDDRVIDLYVHGGLTYSAPAGDEGGHPWTFGFDCAHYMDVMPALEATVKTLQKKSGTRMPKFRMPGSSYKNMAFAKAETESLADQLFKLSRPEEEE